MNFKISTFYSSCHLPGSPSGTQTDFACLGSMTATLNLVLDSLIFTPLSFCLGSKPYLPFVLWYKKKTPLKMCSEPRNSRDNRLQIIIPIETVGLWSRPFKTLLDAGNFMMPMWTLVACGRGPQRWVFSSSQGIWRITGWWGFYWTCFLFLGTRENRVCRVEAEIALNIYTDSSVLVKKSLWYSYLRLCFSHII